MTGVYPTILKCPELGPDIYVTEQVVMVIALAVCTCYATKICCFKLQAEHHRISVRAVTMHDCEFPAFICVICAH